VSGDDDDLTDDDPRNIQPGCSGKEISAHKTAKWVFHHSGQRFNITTATQNRCVFVENWCHGEATGMFAYLKFHFCNMGGSPVSFILLILWLMLILSILASTADNFLVPQLETLSEYLNLSPEVAGLTLLAFGNGAPDIFAAKSALNGGNSDFPLLLCDLLGGSVFISTVVLGSVCIVANKNLGSGWQIDKVTFWRDYIFYICALASILGAASSGSISKTEPLVFVSLYVAYIIFAVATSVMAKKNKDPALGFEDLPGDTNDVDKSALLSSLADGSLSTSVQDLPTDDDNDDDEGVVFVGLDWDPDASKLDKAFFIFEFPFSLLRWISIPAADKKVGCAYTCALHMRFIHALMHALIPTSRTHHQRTHTLIYPPTHTHHPHTHTLITHHSYSHYIRIHSVGPAPPDLDRSGHSVRALDGHVR
jgi:sodium/potassium/calcium exchanger 6